MISSLKLRKPANVVSLCHRLSLMLLLLLLCLHRPAASQGEQLQPQMQQQQHRGDMLGHYEFEVAPKMEPPLVRKPPYQQSGQICPGSDPFGGFSPRDTLCGDLNQGRLPLNPLNQAFGDQSYPFELIKNKTLQFLARALPVLKLEYETIPKVARYLPTNQLLNPTHQASPLSSDHFRQLNQRFAAANGFAPDDELLAAAPYLSRRRKRSTGGSPAVGRTLGQATRGVPVAELSPNATLVLTSAHTAGASQRAQTGNEAAEQGRSSNNSNNEPTNVLAVITKDGYKPIQPAASSSGQVNGSSSNNRQQSTQHAQRARNSPMATYYVGSWAPPTSVVQQSSSYSVLAPLSTGQPAAQSQPSGAQQQQQKQHSAQQLQPSPPASSHLSSSWVNGDALVANKSHKLVQHMELPASGVRSGGQVSGGSNNGDTKPTGQQQQQKSGNNSQDWSQAHATGAATNKDGRKASEASTSPSASHTTSQPLAADSIGQGRSNGDAPMPSSPGSSSSSSSVASKQQTRSPGSDSSQVSKSRHRPAGLSCSDSANGFTSTICQAASALIEGDKAPAWMQVVKHLGSVYSGATSTAHEQTLPGSSPIWSLLGSLLGAQEQTSAKSSGSLLASTSGPKTGGSGGGLMSLIGPLSSLLVGGSSNGAASAPPAQEQPLNKEHTANAHQAAPSGGTASSQGDKSPTGSSLAALGTSAATTLLATAWASNALASLVEYFVPSLFHSASRSFSRRRKPFDPSETFVDTPASLAAAAAAAASMKPQQQLAAAGKQPPTPCPSVEEYISPTFARNYQGAWKYVVQIPHEGYFTQTIQRTSCVRQRCEFTEGVCHESPRWVSLLVAEIYYPNTVFGQTATATGTEPQQVQAQQQQQSGQIVGSMPQQNQLAAASSTNSIQQQSASLAQQQHQHQTLQGPKSGQDPLQMTDSLSNYNHNLNNAFISAANELGWDPSNVANMQHLANAYQYQLLQRNGLMPSHQQTQNSEPRSSLAFTPVTVGPVASQSGQYQYATANNPNRGDPLFSGQSYAAANDYITALATTALQQNPNMNIQDLINSLQLSSARRRRKRDVPNNQGNSNLRQRAVQQQYGGQQQAANNVESMSSLNDINSQLAHSNQMHQMKQQVVAMGQQHQQMNQHYQQQQPSAVDMGAQASTLSSGAATVAAPGVMQVNNNLINTETLAPGQASSSPASEPGNQVECDGHDKLGCYVVRVYYDWFLVNGSCKCWKTSSGQSTSSSSTGGNSILRRIFNSG